jgi:uncharacterized protein (DUF1810 family)
MSREFTVSSLEEFESMIRNKDFAIAQAVVETILNNLNTKRKRLHVLSIHVLDNAATLDITLETKYFIDCLRENIKHYVAEERYEECIEIEKAIEYLKGKEGYL